MTGRRSAPSLPADLKIPRVIPRSKFDLPMAISPVVAVRQHLGRHDADDFAEKTLANRRGVAQNS
jgi:hypothetical protein